MRPLLLDRAPRAEPPLDESPLVAPGTALPDLLAALAARMTPEQAGAFRAKMAAMDQQRGELSPVSVTLGRA